ncbi:MAG: TerB family tellurite resistance protein [Chitinophagaceae bacterium]
METAVKILTGINDEEKGAYLAAIASIATADTQASAVEIEHLTHLCEAADLSASQQALVLQAAASTSEQNLVKSLDILKGSELKYSLLTDLFAFAKSDGNYSEAEQQSVQKIATYLGIDQTQYGLLGELAEKANASGASAEEAGRPDFLSSLGLGDKLKASGINGGGLLKGLVSIAAPIIISKMMNRNGRANSGGGLLGGRGLGSLISILSGGKGMSGAGGLISKIFR